VTICVTVAFAAPGLNGVVDAAARSDEIVLDLPSNATIADALLATGFDATKIAAAGVWGKMRPLTFVLREHDRVEIYRPLQADPKAARRARDDGTTQRKRKA
jgi:uncharacterized protein